MHTTAASRPEPESRLSAGAVFVGVLIAIAALRIGLLIVTPFGLGPDEAQYWRWAQTLDWGYFSKPPMVAWMISLSTSVFGEAEWAVRLAAPIFHGLGGWCLYVAGRALAEQTGLGASGTRVGILAGLAYVLMPGVTLSAMILSTDALFLPALCCVLMCWLKLRQAPAGQARWGWGALMGLAIGFGLLSKYAMVYGLGGLVVSCLIDSQSRRVLLSGPGLLAFALGIGLLMPNLYWNSQNDFETLGHTVENANWSRFGLHWQNLPKFVADQMAVFGPVGIVLLVLGVTAWRHRVAPAEGYSTPLIRVLGAFVLIPVTIIAVQAVLSRAHANWAASAYPAASLLVALWLVRANAKGWQRTLVAANVLVAVLYLLVASNLAIADATGANKAFKRLRDWPRTVELVRAEIDRLAAAGTSVTAVLVDEREVFHGLDYYGVRTGILPVPLRAWRKDASPGNFADGTFPLRPEESANTLFLNFHPREIIRVGSDFASFTEVGRIAHSLGPQRSRRLTVYLAGDFAPLVRDAAYEARMRQQSESLVGSRGT